MQLSAKAGARVYAAVDVGFNSVHLLVAEVVGHRLDPLADESVKLGLGDTVESLGTIPAPDRDVLVAELVRYAQRARALGARGIAFVATQPLRRAADARAVVAAVEEASGVPLHVLDHQEEGLLNVLGATSGRPVEGSLAVVDIGGGSTEVVLLDPGEHARSRGLPIGCATLTRRLVAHDPSTVDEEVALREAARRAVADAPPGSPRTMLAVGGTASNLVKVVPAAAGDRIMTPASAPAGATVAGSVSGGRGRGALRDHRAGVRILPPAPRSSRRSWSDTALDRATASRRGSAKGWCSALARAGDAWRDRLDALAHGWGA